MQDLERNWYEVSGFPGGVRVEPAETGRGICSVVGRQLRGEVSGGGVYSQKICKGEEICLKRCT